TDNTVHLSITHVGIPTYTILSLIYGTRSSEKYGTYHCHFVSPPGQYPTMYSDKEQVFNCIQRTIAALVYPVTSRFSCAWGYCTGDKTISLNVTYIILYILMVQKIKESKSYDTCDLM
uniref:Uncharacterized protein n=1 Tax=Oncorhynchus tshawytscha TaxID=74940 RepID=A0AAZ3QKH0_ONCTS